MTTLTKYQHEQLDRLSDPEGSKVVGTHLGMPVYKTKRCTRYAIPPRNDKGRKLLLRMTRIPAWERQHYLAIQGAFFPPSPR